MRHYQQKSLWTTSLKWLQFGLIFAGILLIAGILFFNHGQGVQSNQISNLKSANSTLKSNIINKKKSLDAQMQQEALNNTNPIIKKSSRQLAASTQAEQNANDLFPILINYSSGKAYLARSNKASKYIARHVLQDKQIFDNRKNIANYIDYSGLHSHLMSIDFSAGNISDKNLLPVIIKVYYLSWFTNKRRSANQDLYLGTYDYATGKFSQLYRFGNIFEGAENGD